MKRLFIFAVSILILFNFSVSETFACTTFCLKSKGEVLFGKNYDWMIDDGFVFVNKRGLQKVSTAKDTPAKWISKYGSVTFNQYGRENPMGGMNEAGLVIELMWLDETEYPKADSRPSLDTLEWIQYQLDTSATVEEVLKNSENVRIDSEVTLHYLVNDKSGNSATVEFLDGKLIAHSGEKLSVSALANDTYEKSLNYLKTTPADKAKTESSFDRFTRAAQKTKEFEAKPKSEQKAVNYAFDILANVEQKNSTQWSIVYDQRRGKIHWRSRQSPTIKTVDTKSFDNTCGSAVKIFDINSKQSGDVTTNFFDYTREANRDLIERAFGGTPFLKSVPAMAKDFLASYAENFTCEVKNKNVERQPATESKTAANFGDYLTAAANVWRNFIGYLFG